MPLGATLLYLLVLHTLSALASSIGTLKVELPPSTLLSSLPSASLKLCIRPFAKMSSSIYGSCPLGEGLLQITNSSGHALEIALPISVHVWPERVFLEVIVSSTTAEKRRLGATVALAGNEGWHHVEMHTNSSHLSCSIRLECSHGFYGSRCSKKCVENERYRCAPDGSRSCAPGWDGEDCAHALCKLPCLNGVCVAPDTCECDSGFIGRPCQCIPLSGCVHGGCRNSTPNTCTCEKGWAGPLCDYDLNFCSNHAPCENGGTCSNGGRSQFKCTCPKGFTGERCELPIADPCHTEAMCSNGGSCVSTTPGVYSCNCPPGFTGTHCQFNDANPCQNYDCYNGASCLVVGAEPTCLCPSGFYGQFCQLQSLYHLKQSAPTQTESISPLVLGLWGLAGLILILLVVLLLKIRHDSVSYTQQNEANLSRENMYKAIPLLRSCAPEERRPATPPPSYTTIDPLERVLSIRPDEHFESPVYSSTTIKSYSADAKAFEIC